MEQFDDIGPSVVLASPGMMQSGLSRELFENWCTDKRNGCIIAGYCVEGTLAKVCCLCVQDSDNSCQLYSLLAHYLRPANGTTSVRHIKAQLFHNGL